MSRKQRGGKGRALGGAPQEGAAAQQRPQGAGGAAAGGSGGGSGWGPLRDSIRRDIEQAVSALAFAERLHQKLDTQRRVFLDFPRAMEQLRSGAIERVAVALSRLYEGGQGFDLQRFLRDLPLALAHLAAADRSKSQPPPAEGSAPPPGAPSGAAQGEAQPAPAAPSPDAPAPSSPPAEAAPPSSQPAQGAPPSTPSAAPAPTPAEAALPMSPRLELRAKLLAAAPQLAKAAAGYRRNVATLKRAAQPRRSPGPWRADREVLEEARRAVEFVHKLYDAYAEAWADQPLPLKLHEQTSAEVDRFLAWTQLDRYVELAVLASTNAPRPPKPGQQVFSAHKDAAARESAQAAAAEARESAPPPVTEASPGAVVATPEPGPAYATAEPGPAGATPPDEAPTEENPPVQAPEPGQA